MGEGGVCWGAPRRFVVLSMLVGVFVVGVFACSSAPALAARGHVFDKSFGEPCSSEPCGPGKLKEPSGVAVNEATGDVYVVDKGDNRVEWFSPTGTYLGQFDGGATPAGSFSAPEGIAIDDSTNLSDPSAGDVYVVDTGHDVIDKFSSTGEYLGQLPAAGSANELDGVGVDTAGEVWVYQSTFQSSIQVASFNDEPANAPIAVREPSFIGVAGNIGFALSGFAVDSQDNFYLLTSQEEGARVPEFNSEGKDLSPGIDEEQSSGVAVEPNSDDVYVDNVETVGRFGPEGTLLERLALPGAHGSGVGVNAASGEAFVADAAGDVIDRFVEEPPSMPRVEGESVTKVTFDSARFGAEINPRGEAGEAITTYHFEYGPCATQSTCVSSGYANSIPVSDGTISSDFEVHTVGATAQELEPHTTYHFRVRAHNGHGTEYGKEETFVTQVPGGESSLPDGRAWEMVSPPAKHGALIEPIGERGISQAAADGSAFTYFTDAPTEGEPRGFSNSVQVFSTRGSGGWSNQDIAPPHSAATGPATGQGLEYRFFSNDLSQGIIEPQGEFTPLANGETSEETSPHATERTPYLRADSTCQAVPATCYTPLLSSADVLPGVQFGGAPEATTGLANFAGATSDLNHIVLTSEVPLTETTPLATEGGLYEWAAGRLALVSILPGPGGEPAHNNPALGENNRNARHAISDDGSRIVFSEHGGEKHLYLRDTAKGETVQLDVLQSGTGEGLVEPRFQIASSDGSRVFFTDGQALTEGSGIGRGEGQGDLYECEIVEAAGKLQCQLTDLTPMISGRPSEAQGSVLGASTDGSYVYFVANGVLAQGAAPGRCVRASVPVPLGATCNLYVRHDGATRFVASLSGHDLPDWQAELGGLTARVSANGEWLAFMSQRELTGYDNHDAHSGQPDEEVYLFDAARPVSEGDPAQPDNPVCASCDPTGAQPVGVEYAHLNDALVGGDRVWPNDTWIAANIPGWTPYTTGKALYQSRYLSNSGRLFFNSSDALAPQDINDAEDVYEYEPLNFENEEKKQECPESSATFSAGSDGCVDLISAGTSGEESAFLDASETGGDVFFLTSAQLALQDTDTSLDVYDAHECTSAAPCLPASVEQPPPCVTEASCKPAPAPQPAIFGAPSSATFSGPGNPATGAGKSTTSRAKPLTGTQKKLARALKVCRKKPKKKRQACEKQAKHAAKHAYGPARKAKKSRKGASR